MLHPHLTKKKESSLQVSSLSKSTLQQLTTHYSLLTPIFSSTIVSGQEKAVKGGRKDRSLTIPTEPR